MPVSSCRKNGMIWHYIMSPLVRASCMGFNVSWFAWRIVTVHRNPCLWAVARSIYTTNQLISIKKHLIIRPSSDPRENYPKELVDESYYIHTKGAPAKIMYLIVGILCLWYESATPHIVEKKIFFVGSPGGSQLGIFNIRADSSHEWKWYDMIP